MKKLFQLECTQCVSACMMITCAHFAQFVVVYNWQNAGDECDDDDGDGNDGDEAEVE